MRRIKTLGAAMVAALALSALAGAGTASAAAFDAGSAANPAEVRAVATSGTSLQWAGVGINCSAFPAEFSNKPAPTKTLLPTGGSVSCESSLWGKGTLEVPVGSCAPILQVSSVSTATFENGPPGCKPFTINMGGGKCVITVAAQTGLSGGTLSNQESGGIGVVAIDADLLLKVSSTGGCNYTSMWYEGSWKATGRDINTGTQVPLKVREPGVYMGKAGFESEEYPVKYVSDLEANPLTLTRYGRTIGCEVSGFSGLASGASTSLPLDASAEFCSATILGTKFPATVSMNGCQHVLQSGGQFNVACAGGAAIEFKAYENSGKLRCTYTVAPQSGVSGVEYATLGEGSKRTISFDIGSNSLSVSATPAGIFCGPSAGVATLEAGGVLHGLS